jgi:virulence-associated protein VapD
MFAISFDMTISDLKLHYGDPYNNAYFEISEILERFDFYRTQGSVYLSMNSDLVNVTRAMIALKMWIGLGIPLETFALLELKTGQISLSL